jgi:ATP/maltotriose-dependent transcriptional regulator MalT
VLVLLGMRDRERISAAGLGTLEVCGLAAADAAALVDRTGAPVDAAVRNRIVAETRGNPLAILEAVATLTDAELLGKTPITHPLAVGALLEQASAQRLDGLPRDTRDALLIAAASDTGSAGEVARALAQAGLSRRALEPAEQDRVITLGGERVEFRHPLVRSAAYHRHGPAERRTMGAGRALWLAGQGERAAALLDSVLDLAAGPAARADLQQLRGLAMFFTSPVSETYAMLVAEADRVEPHDRARASALRATAAFTSDMAGDLVGAVEMARRALAGAGPEGRPIATMVLAHVTAGCGQVDEAFALLEPMLGSLESIDPLGELSFVLSVTAILLVWIEQWEHARKVFDRIIGAARTAGAPTVLPFPLAMFSEFELRRGKIAAAYAAAAESVQLAAETGQAGLSSFSLVVLARVEAVLGHDEDCRAHVAAGLEFSRRTGSNSIEIYAAAVLGLLELSRGHADRAATHLAECSRLDKLYRTDTVLPTIAQSAADLIEAHIRSGAMTDAKRSLAMLEGIARRTGLKWANAGAARCRGMLASEDRYEREFQTALALYGEEMAFERARTQLALGMRRRRSRRRADARAALHEALTYFDRSGAEPWARQARAELTAAGEMPPRDTAGGLRSLTPQELQVALLVAQGSTNRETAAALFLSPKTVEFHLGNTYRKLGVRSRAELVRRVEGLA